MEQQITISTFYKFIDIHQPRAMRDALKRAMIGRGIHGTIILAPDGINATVSGKDHLLHDFMNHLQSLPQVGGLDNTKYSKSDTHPFGKPRVKCKERLINVGIPNADDPTVCVGTYVKSEDWNDIISAKDVITIDTRNDYEYRIGRFKGAINPDTATFKDIVEFTKTQLDASKHKRVAMYCTGGIRCEKYSAYLLNEGFEEVYHLQGGILQYLEDMPKSDTMWEGECFVFDERVAVTHDIAPSKEYTMCYGCGEPLSSEDRKRPEYESPKQCHRCIKRH